MYDIERMSLTSFDVSATRIEIVKRFFPEVVKEGKIDFDALQRSLGQWIDPGKETFWPELARQSRVYEGHTDTISWDVAPYA